MWRAFRGGAYPRRSPHEVAPLLAGEWVRWGAWGDPAAIPLHVYTPILESLEGWQGYTQQWRHLRARDWGWLMASTHSRLQALEARARGWRSFRVREEADTLLPGEAICPASDEWEALGRKRRTCQECRQCGGLGQEGAADRVIIDHGFREGMARQLRLGIWPKWKRQLELF